jgi:hypothetical protein
MDNGIGLLANTHEELTHDMCFPGQLRGISDVLPLAAAVCEKWIARFDALRHRAKDFEQICACVSTALLDNVYTYPFSWYTSRDKKYSPFVTTYGVSSVGQVC